MRSRLNATIIILVLILALPLAAFGAMSDATSDALQGALQDAVGSYNLAGAALLARSPQGDIWKGSVGYSNYQHGVGWCTGLKNGLGSITKTFTSTALLQLVDEGKLTLEQTVEDILPGLLKVGGSVTVQQLLTMSSGLNHYENTATFTKAVEADPLTVWSLTEIAKLNDGLAYKPGDHFDYNNGNYFIVGLMIEKLSGLSWHKYIDQRILQPLGMTRTGSMIDRSMPYGVSATPQKYLNGQVIDATYTLSPSVAGPSGAMYSTVDDMLTWSDAFFDGVLLNDATQAKRMSKLVDIGGGNYFGLGVVSRAHGAMGFSGSFNDVYSADWERLEGWQFVVLSNGLNGPSLGNLSSASGVYFEVMKALGLGGY